MKICLRLNKKRFNICLRIKEKYVFENKRKKFENEQKSFKICLIFNKKVLKFV